MILSLWKVVKFCVQITIFSHLLLFRSWQKEFKLARLLEEISCEQNSSIFVCIEQKSRVDELISQVVILASISIVLVLNVF